MRGQRLSMSTRPIHAVLFVASSLLIISCSSTNSTGGNDAGDAAGGDVASETAGSGGGGAGNDAATEGGRVDAMVDTPGESTDTSSEAGQDASAGDVARIDVADAGAADGGALGTFVTIPATANIWGAGHAAPPDPSGQGAGILPILVALPSGTGRTMTVTNVSGTVDFDGPGTELPGNDADGFVVEGLPPLPPDAGLPMGLGGIAPLVGLPCFVGPCTVRAFFLAAVFLDAGEPADLPPAPYAADPTAAVIDGVALRQTFFVGDGLNGPTAGSGATQTFHIPDGATRLFFGFFDVSGGPGGPIGGYNDNAGRIMATVTVAR
jgi:hypothetical protein